jgi:hypothetical protein
MSFFPTSLIINAFDGSLSEVSTGNVTDNMGDTVYTLDKVMGCKAIYSYKTTKLIVVAKGSKYVSVG